ncbi:MAG: serine/threonine-protein phosphatase [Bacteroidia bacterium]|nr:serine/threonine-protein phosphatase [Bacteroidia bacterium]
MLRLLHTASTFMNLDYRLSRATVGEALHELLEQIDVANEPQWCPPDSMERSRKSLAGPAQYFFYQPHTFPEMDPLLERAHQLQHALLPKHAPRSEHFRVTAVLESFCHLSGDLFGWEDSDDGGMHLWLMDMSGHGLHAGLLAALLSVIMTELRDEKDISRRFSELNRLLCGILQSREDVLYATGVLLDFGPEGVQYVSAAHPALLHRRGDGHITAAPAAGRPLGVFTHSTYQASRLDFRQEDVLLLCTDGIIEAGNADGNEYGLGRLSASFAAARGSAQDIAGQLYQAVASFQDMRLIDDDVTFLVVERQ